MSGCQTRVLKVELRDFPVGSADCLPITVPPDTVEVWKSSLDRDPLEVTQLASLLSEDELTRTRRFHFDADRKQFVVARGLLRVLLGSYLQMEPSKVRFQYSRNGKPSLEGSLSFLQFNLSHSGGVVVFAFTRGCRVGVDVEQIRTDFDLQNIAVRFFSSFEQEQLRSLTPHLRHRAFFLCWTRKEAYIKATGGGLSMPLHQFDVSVAPDEPAALLSTRPQSAEAHRWCLENLEVGQGYAAAVAVEQAGAQVCDSGAY